MKAIIFGVTGQDGSHLADLLLDKGYEVVGVSRRASTDNTQRIKHLIDIDRFKVVHGDITDVFSVGNILSEYAEVDEIYNLAAQSHVAISFKQPAVTWDITGKGCLNILQSMVDLGLHARFYQASSSEMFGSSYDISREQVKYQDENTKFLPQSPYAIAKCAAHYMTRVFREAYGTHASSGILFNHEGPRRGEDFVTRKITKWIGNFIRWCNKNNIKPIELVIDKDEVYIPGRISTDQNFQFPKLQQESPDDYVICTGQTFTIREFLDVAFSHAGINDWVNYVVEDPEFYRPAEVSFLRGVYDKARAKLGWEPKHSFDSLVKLMVENDINENL